MEQNGRIEAVRGPHYYVQGGEGLFYSSFHGRTEGHASEYVAEYDAFEKVAREAVIRAGRPYVSLFDMRDFGPMPIEFGRWAMQTLRDDVYDPEARAMLVTPASWAAVQAKLMQVATLGRVRVFPSDRTCDAVDYLSGALPAAARPLRDLLACAPSPDLSPT